MAGALASQGPEPARFVGIGHPLQTGVDALDGESGSTSTAAPPAISGAEAVLEVTTGAPHAIASMIGSPNPS